MNYRVVPSIKAKGYPVNQHNWREAHKAAQEHERKKFGNRRFKALEEVIEKKLPIGELAGSHTKEGKIIVSAKIPEKYHEQIAAHEVYEHHRMERKRKLRRTKRR